MLSDIRIGPNLISHLPHAPPLRAGGLDVVAENNVGAHAGMVHHLRTSAVLHLNRDADRRNDTVVGAAALDPRSVDASPPRQRGRQRGGRVLACRTPEKVQALHGLL
jgi:hypothetical protein